MVAVLRILSVNIQVFKTDWLSVLSQFDVIHVGALLVYVVHNY